MGDAEDAKRLPAAINGVGRQRLRTVYAKVLVFGLHIKTGGLKIKDVKDGKGR